MTDTLSRPTILPFDGNRLTKPETDRSLTILVRDSCPWRLRQIARWVEENWPEHPIVSRSFAGDDTEISAIAEDKTVLMFCERPEARTAARWLEIGAAGVVPYDLEPELAKMAVDYVLAGGRFLPCDLSETSPENKGDAFGLTPREAEVGALLVEGLLNKEIAFELQIAEATVKVYVRAILRKLRCNNRNKAARILSEDLPVR